MAESNAHVTRPPAVMLRDVISESERQAMLRDMEAIRAEMEMIRADVIPIGDANIRLNPIFMSLSNAFETFEAQYGVQVKDMDFTRNPGYEALEHRVDVLEQKVTTLGGRVNGIVDQYNAVLERLRVIERKVGVITS